MKTLMSQFANPCTGGNMIRRFHLRIEFRLDMNDNDSNMFPIDIRTYLSDIIGFRCIIELEINRIVDMPEFIHIIETDLKGHDVMKNRGSLL